MEQNLSVKALMLLRSGCSDDDVARRTGLSFEDILGLRGELAAGPFRSPRTAAEQPSR